MTILHASDQSETIARWLGWRNRGDYWQPQDIKYTWYMLPDFRNDLDARERIKLYLNEHDASIKLIRRARRTMCWRLVVGLQGASLFDEEHYSEGALWVKAALHFAGVGE